MQSLLVTTKSVMLYEDTFNPISMSVEYNNVHDENFINSHILYIVIYEAMGEDGYYHQGIMGYLFTRDGKFIKIRQKFKK
jgi:hypothetical protein